MSHAGDYKVVEDELQGLVFDCDGKPVLVAACANLHNLTFFIPQMVLCPDPYSQGRSWIR